jgi:hypothetical protein
VKRERFFECLFVSDRNEYRFHFRAWSAEEAGQHLLDDLRDHGLTASGELRVLDPRGRVVLRSEYVPGPGRSGPRPQARRVSGSDG